MIGRNGIRGVAVAASLPGTVPEGVFAEDEALALALAAQPANAPEGLLSAIEAEIDADQGRAFTTRRADEGTWDQRTELIWKKVLHEDAETGRSIYYLRCEPGAVIPPHRHESDEHVLVLEGSFQIEGTTVRTGDSHFSRKGTRHAEITSPEGCLLLLHV